MKRALIIGIVLFIFSCEPRQGQQANEVPPTAPASRAMNELVAKEVIQANNYTYVRGDQKGSEVWIAILKREIEIGKTYYYCQAMEMKGFKSKELDRTFDTIFFLEGISDSPDGNNKAQATNPHDPSMNKNSGAPRQEMNIQHKEGEIAIGELYNKKESLASKKVKVRGVVTKFNQDIMDRNWVHIQDGTGGTSSFDLTITTNDRIEVGTIAIFEGIVAIDKDFGHGYKYDLMLEEASLLNKKSDTKIN